MNAAVDTVLALALVWLAVQAVSGASLFRSIVMFIVFGLFMAIAWARLHAPDLALAEAAIGAGVTGALLLATYRRLYEQVPAAKPPTTAPARRRVAAAAAVLATALVGALALGALGIEREPGQAGVLAVAAQDQVGLGNPVTAVLLAFRGWDTLLELVVLLAAFAGARAVATDVPTPAAPMRSPLLDALLSIVVPLTVVVGVYLLRTGGHAPGGAFQAGAVLAAGGVLLVLAGRLRAVPEGGPAVRVALVAGVAVFVLAGLAALAREGALLALRDTRVIYAVETAMTLSIAIALALLFAGGAGLARRQP